MTLPEAALLRPSAGAVLALFLAACSRAPASPLPPVGVTSEPLVSAPITLNDTATGPSGGTWSGVSVVYGAGEYFGIMSDGPQLYGMRFSTSGEIVGDSVLLATVPGAYGIAAAAAFDGTNFRVLYDDGSAEAIRISPAGVVLDAAPTAIGTAVISTPLLACDGAGACLAATTLESDGGAGDQAQATFVTPLDTDDHAGVTRLVNGSEGTFGATLLGFSGSFLLAWPGTATEADGGASADPSTSGELWTLALDATGAPSGAATEVASGFPESYSTLGAVDGEHALVSAIASTTGIMVAVDSTGAALAPAQPVADDVPLNAYPPYGYTLTSLGAGYAWVGFINWGVGLYPVTVDGLADGGVEGAGGLMVELSPSAASDGTNVFLLGPAQTNYPVTNADVYSMLLGSDGAELRAPHYVTSGPSPTYFPAGVGANGASFLTAWIDDRDGEEQMGVYGTLTPPDGGVVTRGIPIAPDVGAIGDCPPAVASNGSSWLVAFGGGDSYEVQATVLSTDADASTSAPVTLTRYAVLDQLSAASNGTDYVIAWNDGRDLVEDLYLARIDSTGALLDPNGVKVATASSVLNDEAYPTVARAARAYLLAWRDQTNPSTQTHDAYVAWVADDLSLTSAPGSATGGASDVVAVSAACGPNECVLLWAGATQVFVQRYAATGAPLGGPAPVPGAQGANAVAVDWDGQAFVVTWSVAAASAPGSASYALWMATNGAFLGAAPTPIEAAGGTYTLAGLGGTSLLAYEDGAVLGLLLTSDVPVPLDAGLIAPTDASASGEDAAAPPPLVDGGAEEAGATTEDAAAPDAGTSPSDASSEDASASGASSEDASPDASSPPASGSAGCGCRLAPNSQGGPGAAALLAAIALVAARRANRRRRFPSSA